MGNPETLHDQQSAISILNSKIAALESENAELVRRVDIAEHNERDLRDMNARLKHDKKVLERMLCDGEAVDNG